ncbi:hypothetical protein [Clostridium tyrobutyricum]|uniref:hypothetical protein n=1 Tax=Clostridium tyrobutyricum TaxID=1519 RepID=UPI0011CC874B|nr:hypothetical protein [Clostridium tyrobutyricum]
MKIGDNYFIDINRILPSPALEDFYVEGDDKKKPIYSEKTSILIIETNFPGMHKLFELGIIES